MEGLFQIIIVLVFVAVSILDGVSRKKRQQEQNERMKRAESAEEEVLFGDPEEAAFDLNEASAATASSPATQERETADQLVPSDLWAILTGQAPLPGQPGSTVERQESQEFEGSESTPGPKADPDPRVIRPSSASVPAPMASSGNMEKTSPPVTRRSARWMEGLDREPADLRSPRVPDVDGLDAKGVWGAYEDIALGEIGSMEEGGLQYEDGIGGERGSRHTHGRDSTSSRYARLLTSGREEDLRSAIVLREVLGPPVGQRGFGRDDG
jgi:hypothetical protein